MCRQICYIHFCWQPSQLQNYSRMITHEKNRIGHSVSVYAWTEWLPWLDGLLVSFSSVQMLSHVRLFMTPWTAALQASLSTTLLELAQTHVHQVHEVIQPSHPLSSLYLPAFNLSRIRVFSHQSVLRKRWPKYWSFSFSLSPSNEYSGLISFRIDWFDLPAVQGTLKSLLQHYSSKASILRHSAFFLVQLSYLGFPYSSVGKESACSAGDPGSIPGLGRSPGKGNGDPLQYPCLENLMDKGAWWAVVHGVTRSRVRLSD